MSKLRDTRKARKLTLTKVAAAVGTDPGNLSRIERGAQTPSLELAKRISNYFAPDVSVLDVLAPHGLEEDRRSGQDRRKPAA